MCQKEECVICNPTLKSYEETLIICKAHQSSIDNNLLILVETNDPGTHDDMTSEELHKERTGYNYYLHYSDWYMVTHAPIPPLGVAFVPVTVLNSFYKQETKMQLALHELKYGAVVH